MSETLQTILKDRNYSQRTQISLSPTLRRVIDVKCRLSGGSLAEYIRGALILRLINEEKDRKTLKRALKIFFGSLGPKNHPEWKTQQDVLSWQRKLRAER